MSNLAVPQVLLIILDGWGYREDSTYNAIAAANPVFYNSLWNTYPHTLLPASGTQVGLPDKNIGTSEIGHTIIGCGTIIDTDMVRISKAFETGEVKNNPAFHTLIEHLKKYEGTLHLLGLVSPGGVHSHQDHLHQLLLIAKQEEIKKVVIHIFTDGRDTPPQSAKEYVSHVEEQIKLIGLGEIVSISGRYYAMDRDNNLDRIKKTEKILFEGGNPPYPKTIQEAIDLSYKAGITDEFILPTNISPDGKTPTVIKSHDGVLFFNFRPDRARELSKQIAKRAPDANLCFVTMTQYDPKIGSVVFFPPPEIKTTLSQALSDAGRTQVHIAETEKYAHVTYFLNGGIEKEHPHEKFVLIESRKDIPTHDLAPEMKAKEIAERTLQAIDEGVDFIAINLANADMVGHTGKWEPTIKAIHTIDLQLERIITPLLKRGGIAVITADHGNAELMFDETTHQPVTSHTLNPVPLIITKEGISLRENGTLADIAPTILKLFNVEKPFGMTGESLF